ncbi:MAG TPA: ATP-dependent DNA helicase RecQ [Terracidiphilus sp.]|jgi:ATP-dependent DNA helicase RecQ|nr:ATP-dependent DNA helicase RecQ [Terracidiphilus sp.]
MPRSATRSSRSRQVLDQIDIPAKARELLGFPSLRPGQEDAIRTLMEGGDTLLVQPTGSGKSAVYQIAGNLLRGCTVIVSPLIALQKDQAEAIEASKLDETAVLNSTLSTAEQRDTFERIEKGEVEYIFLAPEQLRNRETIERLRAARVSLFVIDEAHCVSQWGHDFRPDYLELSHVIDALGRPTTLAMTATASKDVREEIIQRLGLRSPRVIVHDFDRPNISLRVDIFSKASEKVDAVLRRVEFADKPGIVYVATHRNAETIAADLKTRGIDAIFYHGGLKAKEREAIQDRFMCGDAPVIVATNAFGMGVDKPDIRFVYHADVSESLDAYYQEIGRSGRDGKPAEAVLFFRARDIGAQQYKTGSGSVDTRELESVVSALSDHDNRADPKELSREIGISSRKLTNIVHKLEEVGVARKLDSGEIQVATRQSLPEITEAAAEQQESYKQLRKRCLEEMREYAETRACRRAMLLRHFGEEYAGPCGNCDRCEARGFSAAHGN